MTSEAGRKPTIIDVAREASVSQGTASDALRGSDRVTEETRKRVKRAAENLGYRVNRVAQGLRTGQSGLIALMLPSAGGVEVLAHEYYVSALIGASRAAVAGDLGLVLLPEIDGDSTGAELADGVIVIDPPRRDPSVKRLRKEGTPVVTIGTDPSLPGDPWAVIADNEENCRSVLDRLRASGARRIVLISSDEPWGWFLGNEAAYRGWANEVEMVTTVLSAGPGDRDGARAATADLLTGEDPPDALLALTVDSAIGALEAAQDEGIEVPEGLQIAGLVDGAPLRDGDPAITCFDLDPVAQAEAAVKLLMARIRGEEPSGPVVIDGRLIERESTRPVRDGG